VSLPRDFLEEVESELQAARLALLADTARADALEELQRIARAVSAHLGRPVTVFDVIRATTNPEDQKARIKLVRQLRRC
jgi:hypothetical protein